MGSGIMARFRCLKIDHLWRKNNQENDTHIVHPCDVSLIEVGTGTYGPIKLVHAGKQSSLKIGRWCSIAPEVTFIINDEHFTDTATTYPFKRKLLEVTAVEAFGKGGITIGDDVWIGYGATITDGVTIGQGAVVAAGALVVKDVQPYEIVGGCPAKHLKWRYSESVREIMSSFDWEKVDKHWIESHIDSLYESPLQLKTAMKLVEDLSDEL